MLTLEKLTAAAQQLPAGFSLGQLVDRLVRLEQPTNQLGQEAPATGSSEAARYTTPEAEALYAKFPALPPLQALRGIAAGLSPEDKQKAAKEWEAERIQEKYGL